MIGVESVEIPSLNSSAHALIGRSPLAFPRYQALLLETPTTE
jgi:hypothetical protein